MPTKWLSSMLFSGKTFLTENLTLSGVGLVVLVLLLPFLLGRYTQRTFQTADSQGSAQVELTDLIVKVKSDLYAAEKAAIAKGEAPLLTLQDVELEVSFLVQAKTASEVKLVVTSGSSEVEIGRTQRVKLRLGPIPAKTVEVAPEKTPLDAGAPGVLIGPSVPPKR